jgi:phage terminase large subunit
MDYELLPAQDDFVFSESLYPAIVGGLGSGKSRAGTLRLVTLLVNDKGANGAYYMPTYDLINLRAIPGIEEDLALLGLEFKTNKSTYTIDILGYGIIILRSYDRPERIIAYEVAHSVVDEIDTLPKAKAAVVWRKIAERNRQKRSTPNTIGCVTTPDQGINGFVYDKWVKKQQDGYELIKAKTLQNKHLPDGYVEQITANYDAVLADLYLNGEFVSLTENKVYHFFNREEHHADRELTVFDKFIYVGVDFNIGGVCASAAIIENNIPIFIDEFVSYDTYDFTNKLTRYQSHTVIVYPDASGGNRRTNATESDIAIIEAAGFTVEYGNKNPAVRDRINSVNRLLSHKRFKINTDKCPEITHALETQGYTENGEPEKFAEHPAVDDWIDGLGYMCFGVFPVNHMRSPKVVGFYR